MKMKGQVGKVTDNLGNKLEDKSVQTKKGPSIFAFKIRCTWWEITHHNKVPGTQKELLGAW